jgi:hypothetical protein
MITTKPPMQSVDSVRALVEGGDWACSHNQCATLRFVASQLATAACPLAEALADVARACETDMLTASALWLDATAPLRSPPRR